MEDVGVEEMEGVVNDLVADPADRPDVEGAVAIVHTRPVLQIGRQRPRVDDRQRGKQHQRE